MTRRIALTVLALVTVLLVLAVVPLGVLLTEREETSFRSAAEASARALASAAEENLSDHKPETEMLRVLADTQADGGCAAVYDATGQAIARTSCTTATGGSVPAMVTAVLAQPRTDVTRADGRLTVAAPIGDSEDAVGVAVLVRSADPLNDRIAVVWGWLAAIGVAGLLAGVLLSVRLARWVGSPLREVDEAAQRLGEGALEVRAPTGRGPQEVRRLAATFNTMAGRNEALVHGHRTVIADVSHQLRTPLAALRLRLDLLAADADEETATDLAGAQDEIARLSRLVDGLLAVARAESAVPRPVTVRVDQVVAERIAAWEPLASERGVALAGHCPDGLSAPLGAGDLEQVLDNLLANALDAVPGGGHVRVEGRAGRGAAKLRVVDDGPGMSVRARESAFRRFGNPEAGGTGLGLAIVHRLVTANGGTARLEDTDGGGLTVELDFLARAAPMTR
ncbi:HAMP domain-containing histidine kinase [Kitasatospora sp. NBC_01287]|uniref:sensor histidine kinase n=1 Tax=Kitasatospora sp. NBC_01287 TaxID=2903573 RepID=UPI002255359E|nr:HAMP domain-containing sensor histidine kinase [Kitasatospora sp. NBC_01287]MCX4744752.1 HAMP domain-containing histidine kinase [Kitasatospora sp. NBC_01287]